MTSSFGYRTDPIKGGTGFHTGVDISAPEGTALYEELTDEETGVKSLRVLSDEELSTDCVLPGPFDPRVADAVAKAVAEAAAAEGVVRGV